MRVVYLHGFASSPLSRKAVFFGGKFAELGIPFQAPALDQGDFSKLTITGQLQVVDQAVGGQPAVLMGSSLGGYLSAWYASRHPEIEKVILLAPAFHFAERWSISMKPEDIEAWRITGHRAIFHYGARAERSLGYQFYEDARGYEPEPDFRQPALIMHGSQDTVVPAELSKAFVRTHPAATLQLFESDHELTDVLQPMWWSVHKFLQL